MRDPGKLLFRVATFPIRRRDAPETERPLSWVLKKKDLMASEIQNGMC